MKHAPRPVIAFSALLCFAALSAQAATTVEDFNSYPADTPLSSPWTYSNPDDGSARIIRPEKDTADIFGEGADNQYLKLRAYQTGTATINLYRNFGSGYGNVGQLDMQVYDPGTSVGPQNNFGLQIRLSTSGGQPANNNTPFWITLYEGDIYDGTSSAGKTLIGNYDLNAVVNFSIVFNNTDSAVTYAGSMTLAAQSYDLWLNGAYLVTGTYNTLAASEVGKSLNSINFGTPSSGVAVTEMLINQITASDIISIPEPAAAALALGLLGLAFAAARRRAS